MTAWRPLVPHRRFTVIGMVFAALAVGLLTTLVVVQVTGTGEVVSWTGVLVSYVLLAIMAVFAWRVARMGVYLSDRGVRVQHIADSDVVEWADVLRFVVRTSRKGWIATVETEEIWLVRRDGERIDTTVARLVDPPLRDVWSTFATVTRNRNTDFDRALRTFEDALARHRR